VKITVVGSINLDSVIKVPHLPVAGETVIGREFQLIPGGKGANQAVGATRLGAEVAMIGCVGDDSYGFRLKQGLAEEGINTDQVYSTIGVSSGMALITVAEDGENTIALALGANAHVLPDKLQALEPLLKNSDILLLQLEIPLETVEAAIRIARRHRCRVVLNPAPAHSMDPEILRQVDYFVPNEIEAAALTSLEVMDSGTAEIAAIALRDLCGAAAIVITMGPHGALLLQNGGDPQWVPAPSVRAVDTTSAGDAFVAGMAVGLARGKSDLEAVRWGCTAGALATTKLGAQPSLPNGEAFQRALFS